MNPLEVLKLADSYGIWVAVLAFLLIVLGNISASWLTQAFFPMRLKKHAWKWEKDQKQMLVRACNATNQDVNNSFTLHVHNNLDFYVRKQATIWIM